MTISDEIKQYAIDATLDLVKDPLKQQEYFNEIEKSKFNTISHTFNTLAYVNRNNNLNRAINYMLEAKTETKDIELVRAFQIDLTDYYLGQTTGKYLIKNSTKNEQVYVNTNDDVVDYFSFTCSAEQIDKCIGEDLVARSSNQFHFLSNENPERLAMVIGEALEQEITTTKVQAKEQTSKNQEIEHEIE